MSRALALLILIAGTALSQNPVAPTVEPVGKPPGQDWNGYNFTNNWEVGVRAHSVGGNEGKYRSDVNYRNGLRLLGGRFNINSKDGHGQYFFDEFLFQTQGLGNDPYEYTSTRLQKNGLYRYDAVWRRNDYYNPALTLVNGRHFLDTVRRMQDHDLTLFPQGRVRFFVGFSRNTQSGAGLSTVGLWDSRGDIFPLFADIRRRQNEIRAGNELNYFGFRLNWMWARESYSEDAPARLFASGPGEFPNGRTQLNEFDRQQPYTGSTPSWRVNLMRERSRWYGVNARFTHSDGTRNFTTEENATGTERLQARNRNILVTGDARRPVTTASGTFSVLPLESLTVTNHFAYHDVRMEGDARLRQIDNATFQQNVIAFQYLGFRTWTNATTAQWALNPKFALKGGFQYASREVRSVEQSENDGFTFRDEHEQTNRLKAGMAGFRWQPVTAFTFQADGEIGRSDRPFLPVSEKDYHGFSGRMMYRRKGLTLTGLAQSNYNFNTASLFVHSSRSRRYSADAAWTGSNGFTLEGGYSRLHLDTATSLAYFLDASLVSGESSLFYSNLNTITFGTHYTLRNLDFYAGYSGVFDNGDGRAVLTSPSQGLPQGSALPQFRAAQVYPIAYQSPLGRISVRLRENLRWNFGYQYYGYREDLFPAQNYRAHTGFTSLLFSF